MNNPYAAPHMNVAAKSGSPIGKSPTTGTILTLLVIQILPVLVFAPGDGGVWAAYVACAVAVAYAAIHVLTNAAQNDCRKWIRHKLVRAAGVHCILTHRDGVSSRGPVELALNAIGLAGYQHALVDGTIVRCPSWQFTNASFQPGTPSVSCLKSVAFSASSYECTIETMLRRTFMPNMGSMK